MLTLYLEKVPPSHLRDIKLNLRIEIQPNIVFHLYLANLLRSGKFSHKLFCYRYLHKLI